MPLSVGRRLGSYEILAAVGAGGMGEVYRARDTKLDRDVALKVLPEMFSADADRLMRFEREAKTLAALNHPSIAHIYGIEESEGVRALVMEFVEGDDLAQRIGRGRIPVEEALALAKQIADAVEAAHGAGVIHRDLKPANIKLRPDGTVKVLDFGLAKGLAAAAAVSGTDSARAATITSPALTQLGLILGTAAYMAPEQAKGQAVDTRADIWAFGVVLYEMLTGVRAFRGDDASDVVAAVLRGEIDWSALPRETPAGIHRLLRRCLQRRTQDRLRDIGDARHAIDDALTGADGAAPAPAPQSGRARGRNLLVAAALFAAGVAIGIGTTLALRAPAAPPSALQFDIHAPDGSGFMRGLALSPDGRLLAFVAKRSDGRTSLWIRSLDSRELRELPETGDARQPFWAPDSRRVGFFSRRALYWTDVVTGGTPTEIAPTGGAADVRGAAWGADETIVYAPTYVGTLLAVSLRGGPSAPAVQLPANGEIGTARFPHFLPDGRRFLFYGAPGTGTEPAAIYLGRLGSLEIKRLGPAHSAAQFAAPGHLLYARGEGLVLHAFDQAAEALVGEPEPLGISMGGSLGLSGLRSLSVAANGTLAFRSDQRNLNQIVWVDAKGKDVSRVTEPGDVWHYAPRLSADRRLLVVSQYGLRGGLGELWVHDLEHKRSDRVTFRDGDDCCVLWIGPREFLYMSDRPNASGGIYRLHLDRPADLRQWLDATGSFQPLALTPDRRVVLERRAQTGAIGLWIRDLDGGKAPEPLGRDRVNELGADLAPNGRWLAFASDVSKGWEIYLRRLDRSGADIRISPGGGTQPRWRPDGRELFYLDSAGQLVSVSMTWPAADGEPAVGELKPLFPASLEESLDRQYDVSLDGQRFLLNRSPTFDTVPISVISDWRLLPQGKR
jgi:Tol biopolymer transport system component